MQRIRLFILILFLSFSAFAYENIKGRIKKINETYLLVTKNQIAYTLSFNNFVSLKQISRLTNGDFASVTAALDSNSINKLNVSSVDYVGLAVLNGIWRSNANLCYEFSSFTRLFVYTPNKQNECVRSNDPFQVTKYTFFINPDVQAWNMLISSANSDFVGELKIINNSHIEIMLFDSETAVILGTIVLRR